MATVKSYTDLEQSKKLVEILPLESADMCFNISVRKNMPPLMIPYSRFDEFFSISPTPDFLIPCWSLAALYSILPTIDDEFEPRLRRSLDKYFCTYEGEEDSSGLWRVADNPIDACVAMIEKLHELKML